MELTVVEQSDDLTVVALDGRLDVQGVSDVEMKFVANTSGRRKPTIVDLSKVEFIASLGMGMLVSAAQTLKQRGARLVLLKPRELVVDSLNAAGLTSVLTVSETMQEARQQAQVAA